MRMGVVVVESLLLAACLSVSQAFVVNNNNKPNNVFLARRLQVASVQTALAASKDDDEEEEKENPYADPNYPELEFLDYSDPEYAVDRGMDEDYYDNEDSTEAEIEEMREDRRRRNDEYQFETYFADVLKSGDDYKGQWTVYKSSTFLPGNIPPDANGMPRLVKSERMLNVISSAYRMTVETDSPNRVDSERICHVERVATKEESDAEKSWKEDVDVDSGFGRHADDDEDDEQESDVTPSPEALRTEEEIMSNTYWPDQLAPNDFRGAQGIMVCGHAWTLAKGVPLKAEAEDVCEGPFAEYRTEVGIQSKHIRMRIKFDYSILEEERSMPTPQLHLKSMTVCREAREMWPQASNFRKDKAASDSLFGSPGASGGLYDPPPVGDEEQAKRYMLLDLIGQATVLFPYLLDQDPEAFGGNGWVTSIDWDSGRMRYQVDRKVHGGTGILGLRTLELSEVQSADADTYRPRDGGSDMRQ